jgi:hypothetical protein
VARSRTASPAGGLATRPLTLAAALIAASAVGASAQAAPSIPVSGNAAVDAEELRRAVGVLAHDSMRGRATPSPELEQTAEYVADRFRAFGLRPGLGEDGYQQRFPLTVVRPGDAAGQTVRLTGPGGTTRLEPGPDFVAAPTGNAATAEGKLSTWRPGRGAAPPSEGVLLVPVTPQTIADGLGRVREALRTSGAPGALIVLDAPDGYFERVRGYFGRDQVSLGEPDVLGSPVVLVRAGSLPEGLAEALDASGSAADAWEARLATESTVEAAEASNTIGWIRGADPDLRDEYVVFSAHMDHLGVESGAEGDSIYNGADDDGSGVAAVLELAQAFARADRPPRRSLIFVTFSGEERGLLGSRWYAEHPLFSLDRTVAAFNIDMIGRNWRDSVAAIGKGLSSLGRTVEEAARDNPELALTVVEDQWPGQSLFQRSDHYHLARKGVPALFFFSGLHEDYHRPSDEIGEIDFEKTARIVRLIYETGRAVADADEAPEWDPDAYDRVVEDAPRR